MRARPLSPHIQVYRPQMTSLLSIAHRITGVWLGVGSLFIVAWLLALAAGPQPYAAMQAFFGAWVGRILMVGWSFSVCFHLANGIRHLFWDAGLGFSLRTTYASGWSVIAITILLTIATWAAAYVVWAG
jgi:succinate dehydrogenase / fumarate reductase, cytochrome b subunit